MLQMSADNPGREKILKLRNSMIQMCGGSDSQGETPGRGEACPPDGTDRHNSSSVLQTPACIVFGSKGYDGSLMTGFR